MSFPKLLRPCLTRIKRSELVNKLFRSGEYLRLRDMFINNGRASKCDVNTRARIVEKFEVIDKSVSIASTPVEGLMLAEIALSLDCEGDFVECGCYAGGSTAKLSIIAHATNRRLHVFDSFEGLPDVDEKNRHDYHARHSSEWVTEWKAGRYACSLDNVKNNVRRFGNLDVCGFTKGWFSDVLLPQNLPKRIAMAFTDVDIPSSARDCLVPLWPLLSERGAFVSHDVAYIGVMQSLLDPDLWKNTLSGYPPIFFGAGFGLGDLAPHLGFAVSGHSVPAAYINSLTLAK